MKTIKFIKAPSFKNGHEYEFKESENGLSIRVNKKIKIVPLEFLHNHRYTINEYDLHAA